MIRIIGLGEHVFQLGPNRVASRIQTILYRTIRSERGPRSKRLARDVLLPSEEHSESAGTTVPGLEDQWSECYTALIARYGGHGAGAIVEFPFHHWSMSEGPSKPTKNRKT